MSDTVDLPMDFQGTSVEPVAPSEFDYDAFGEHEAGYTRRCREFWESDSGVLVHRRFRVPEVYSYGCRDMRQSLAWQLGSLTQSVNYKSDVPNFLEPWYGIGTVASSYGAEYVWADGQSPVSHSPFQGLTEALSHHPQPADQTPIGQHTLRMIDYFLESTKARLPVSLTDTQSPWNTAVMAISASSFLLSVIEDPQRVKEMVNRTADLLIDFTRKQIELLGEAVVWPGHGFASSRVFSGLAMSDDYALVVSPDHYTELIAPITGRVGSMFGGAVFHSCGNWSRWILAVLSIPGLIMCDGAFSIQTDPSPNPPEPFSENLAGTGVVLNARIVGDPDSIAQTVRKLWRPGMRLIVVTYCQTPEEQAEAYDRIHEICGK
ncbi:MAG: hypothetical protein GY794_18630 [bacterium]|nr:hypothetical protein [bacterium]